MANPIFTYASKPEKPEDLLEVIAEVKRAILCGMPTNIEGLKPENLRLMWLGIRTIGYVYLKNGETQVPYSGYLTYQNQGGWMMVPGKPGTGHGLRQPEIIGCTFETEKSITRLYNALHLAEIDSRLAKAV